MSEALRVVKAYKAMKKLHRYCGFHTCDESCMFYDHNGERSCLLLDAKNPEHWNLEAMERNLNKVITCKS